MKLVYSPNSPYARKARIAWRECLVQNVTEMLDSPIAEGTNVPSVNPLGKVPALIVNNSVTIIDSPHICAWFDAAGNGGQRLLPEVPGERIQVLQIEALADGILDAAVAIVFERKRPESQQSEYWLDRWGKAITRTLGELDRRLNNPDNPFNQGTMTTACMLDYLDFRLPGIASHETYPNLRALQSGFVSRSSFEVTAPPG